MATAPCEKKFFCLSTIACATRRIVSKRWRIFLINHLASCNCAPMAPSPLPCLSKLAYMALTRRRGMTSLFRVTCQPLRARLTTTSGTT
ncbi:hypothetical protein D3C81_1607530 [compost metagenome]